MLCRRTGRLGAAAIPAAPAPARAAASDPQTQTGRPAAETAAVAVIHEALHHAGLTEAPHDRLAMTSIEITEMVEDACGF